MKNKFLIKVLMITCFGMVISCSDFLDEDPRGELTPDNFLQNEAEATLALNSLDADAQGAGFNWFLGTDLGVSGRITLAAAHRFGAYDFDITDVRVRWGNEYESIRDANLLLANIDNAPLTDEFIGNVRAQALFYRAYQYINLVTIFGNVPNIRDEVTNISEIALLGQTDGSEVLALVIDDLEEAISSGFLSTASWADNDGRTTVWAARMLKAHAHIWLEEWAEAREELIEITTNSPHFLDDDYADKYRQGNEIHPEIIFGRQFLGNVLSRDIRIAHPNFAGENQEAGDFFRESNFTNGSAPLTLRRSFANSYAVEDERRIYNVFDSAINAAGEQVDFNWIYLPKFARFTAPQSDPLFPNEVDEPRASSAPDRVFLLADAYLLLAEAEFMIGGSSGPALAAINTVRERANIPALTTLTLADIQMERAWELVGEGYWGRKRDLIRWGILDETIIGLPAAEIAAGATPALIERAQDEADIIASNPPGRFTQFPVPVDEVIQSENLGGALVQNPLWIN